MAASNLDDIMRQLTFTELGLLQTLISHRFQQAQNASRFSVSTGRMGLNIFRKDSTKFNEVCLTLSSDDGDLRDIYVDKNIDQESKGQFSNFMETAMVDSRSQQKYRITLVKNEDGRYRVTFFHHDIQ